MTDKSWTGKEFTSFAVALLGSAYGWQSAIARELGVDSRTVRRWVKDGCPDKIKAELLRMAGVEDDTGLAYPRDEWIVGDGPETASQTRREYIIHARPPRFIARVVNIDELTGDPEPDEGDVDITGIVYKAAPDSILCEFQWIDRPPKDMTLTALLDAASNSLG